MTPEAKVKKEIRTVLDTLPGCWYFMPAASVYGRRGVPDFVGLWHGRFFAIEAKSSTGKTTKLQDREIERITAAGGVVGVCRSGDDARELMEGLCS